MLPYRDSRFTKIILVVFFLIVLGYAYFEGRGLLQGPTIHIENGVTEVSQSFISIQGRAERIATLSMNGKAIPVTEEGDFSEKYVLAPGYNRIVLNARDRYGKSTERVIEIVYNPLASSTASTSSPRAGVAPHE